jgi:hypothetical protein
MDRDMLLGKSKDCAVGSVGEAQPASRFRPASHHGTTRPGWWRSNGPTGWGSRAAATTGPTSRATLDFLGFTIHWGKGPTTGKWAVKTRTAADRFRRAPRSVSQSCKEHRHQMMRMPAMAAALWC